MEPRVESQFQFADFFIDFFHKVDDEINQTVLVHLFQVGISNKKADVY